MRGVRIKPVLMSMAGGLDRRGPSSSQGGMTVSGLVLLEADPVGSFRGRAEVGSGRAATQKGRGVDMMNAAWKRKGESTRSDRVDSFIGQQWT